MLVEESDVSGVSILDIDILTLVGSVAVVALMRRRKYHISKSSEGHLMQSARDRLTENGETGSSLLHFNR